VIYVIAPWNYPFFTALNSIAPALLSGNAVLLKHESAPIVGELFERFFNKLCDLEGLCQNLKIDIETSNKLIEELEISHVVFTGSVAGGSKIEKTCGVRAQNTKLRNTFITSSLELGGSDVAYVAADAHPQSVAPWVVSDGRLHNSGQSCCAVKRVLVHEKVYDEFVKASKNLMEKEVCGDPLKPTTTLGPLYGGPQAVEHLMSIVEDAKNKGAHVVCGGKIIEKEGYCFLEPTLITHVKTGMRILEEETFGPLLPVMKVHSDEEALKHAPHEKFGLTASVFTSSEELKKSFMDHSDVGTVFVNWCNDVHPEVVWSGVGHSGNSQGALSYEGFLTLTRPKSMVIGPKII
jgi:acyl-CoA reductase-like NAD-dependent aldehyde dehydrogenase